MKRQQLKEIAIEAIGWYGTAAIVLGYFLVSFDFVEAGSYAFQALNCSGALAIVILSVHKKTYQPAVLNIIWLIVALAALVTVAV